MRDLSVTKTEIGLVSTIASFIYGAGALAGGPLGDRIGEIKTIIICMALSGFSTFIMVAAGFTHAIYVYAVALILIAAWASLYHPTANSLISKTFKGRIAESMGLHGAGGTLGAVLAPVAAGIIGGLFGWTWAFVAFGSLCILLAFVFSKSYSKRENNDQSRGSIIAALRIRELWILLIFNVAIRLFMKGVELFFPTYLVENRGLDVQGAAVAYTLVLAAGVPGQLIGGKAADKIGSKKVLIATSVGVCLSLISILLVPIYLVGIALFIVLYGLSFYAHQPALNSLTGFLSPQKQRGAVYGIFFFTSFGIGSISQVIAGYIADLYGLDSAFIMLTVFAVVALLLALKLPEKRENR